MDLATQGVGTPQAADAVLGDTHPPPRSRILTDCKAPGAGTRPPRCCCPATAVSVFYYDFLRLSVCRPRGVSGDPSVSLCPFPCSQKPSSHMHACTHTPPQATAESWRTAETGTRVTVARPSAPRDLKGEAAWGAGGGGVLGMGPSSEQRGERSIHTGTKPSRWNNRLSSQENFCLVFVFT